MKNMILILSVSVCASVASASVAPLLEGPAASSGIDPAINKLTLEDATKQPQAVRELIKKKSEQVLHHFVQLALKEYNKHNKAMSAQWRDFFSDVLFFNNQTYRHHFETYVAAHPEVKDLICYITAEDSPISRAIYVYHGLFPTTPDAIGRIEYTAYDDFEERPEINNLSVAPEFRKRGMATQLLKRALVDLKKLLPEPADIHLTVLPDASAIQDADKRSPTLDELIVFYKNRGAQLLSKSSSSAQMKIPASFMREIK